MKGSICGGLRRRSWHETALSSLKASRNTTVSLKLSGRPCQCLQKGHRPRWKVEAHVSLLTVTSLFRSAAGESGNYDSLIASNVSEKLVSNRDGQQAKEWLTLERNTTAYMSPNSFLQAFGKTNKQQGRVISSFHLHSGTFNDSPVSDILQSPNKHVKITDKSFNFRISRTFIRT